MAVRADGKIVQAELSPPGSAMSNFALDVTPAHLVTCLIKERGDY